MDIKNSDSFLPKMDWEHLHHISDNSPDFELELLQLFVADSQAQIDMLKKAIASQNFLEIEQIAHHLKGASANIGAIEIQDTAEQFEQQARQQKLENTGELSAILCKALDQIQVFVEAKLGINME